MSTSTHFTRPVLYGLALFILAGCQSQRTLSSRVLAPERADPGFGIALGDAPAPGTVTSNEGELRELRANRIEDLFVGRFAGLDVQRTSPSTISVRFRGAEPLIVIDGLEADASVLSTVQPRTVVRIDFLRDAASTGIYGNRGINGVLVVTTRGS
jgi:TonB-dependent SusC/RagA subfamily outer membrane receptor